MTTKLVQLRQFVARVVSFTSEYSNTNWTSANLIGEPTSGNLYGDTTRAWCPSVDNENQMLELEFESPVYIEKVNVYENLRGGAVTKIETYNPINNEYSTLWSCESPTLIEHYNIFSPSFDCVQFMSNRIRLTLTLENRIGFPEIEAVELVGLSIQIPVPAQSISSDISKLFNERICPDLNVQVIESSIDSHVFQLHRCILKLRCERMLEFFSQVNFIVEDLGISEMKLFLEYVYSDQLNEDLLEKIINENKANNSVQDTTNIVDEICDEQDEDEEMCKFDFRKNEELWMLVLNRLVRCSMFFKQERLTQLLIRYLATKFLNVENVLNILLDSINYSYTSPLTSPKSLMIPDIEFCNLDIRLDLEFKLNCVTDICLAFCRHHIKNMIKVKKFRQLPKKIIVEIVCGL
jgi:hypothetical protein